MYSQPDILADTLYLQANYFDRNGVLDKAIRPDIKLTEKSSKHLLQNGDVLFAAKGLNNYALVYNEKMGRAVASSSFIVILIEEGFTSSVLPFK